MGSYLIKPQLDVDLYVWWSTISDSPVTWGTRKSFLKLYKKRKWMFRLGEDFKEKLERADTTGVSTWYRPWDDEKEIMYGGYGYIRVEAIPALLKIWETDLSMDMDDPKLLWLVEPHEVEDE